ncbi:MAG: hypothetical protein AB7L09_00755 [Nitrospira sp.]
MSIEVQVHVPGRANPVDLDVYADIVATVAGFVAVRNIPDYYSYTNPRTGTMCTVCDADWPQHDQEDRA